MPSGLAAGQVRPVAGDCDQLGAAALAASGSRAVTTRPGYLV